MYLAKIKLQRAVIDVEKEKLRELERKAVEALSPVKVGDVVETKHAGKPRGVVERLFYREGWAGAHHVIADVRLFKKDGSTGKRVTQMRYDLKESAKAGEAVSGDSVRGTVGGPVDVQNAG